MLINEKNDMSHKFSNFYSNPTWLLYELRFIAKFVMTPYFHTYL